MIGSWSHEFRVFEAASTLGLGYLDCRVSGV